MTAFRKHYEQPFEQAQKSVHRPFEVICCGGEHDVDGVSEESLVEVAPKSNSTIQKHYAAEKVLSAFIKNKVQPELHISTKLAVRADEGNSVTYRLGDNQPVIGIPMIFI